jgi:hypothetical protein
MAESPVEVRVAGAFLAVGEVQLAGSEEPLAGSEAQRLENGVGRAEAGEITEPQAALAAAQVMRVIVVEFEAAQAGWVGPVPQVAGCLATAAERGLRKRTQCAPLRRNRWESPTTRPRSPPSRRSSMPHCLRWNRL